jgi:hypothetical protein
MPKLPFETPNGVGKSCVADQTVIKAHWDLLLSESGGALDGTVSLRSNSLKSLLACEIDVVKSESMVQANYTVHLFCNQV